MTTGGPALSQIRIIWLNSTAWRLALYNRILTGFIEQPNPAIADAQIACDLGNVQPFGFKLLYFLVALFSRRVPLLPFALIRPGTNVFTRRWRYHTLHLRRWRRGRRQ